MAQQPDIHVTGFESGHSVNVDPAKPQRHFALLKTGDSHLWMTVAPGAGQSGVWSALLEISVDIENQVAQVSRECRHFSISPRRHQSCVRHDRSVEGIKGRHNWYASAAP